MYGEFIVATKNEEFTEEQEKAIVKGFANVYQNYLESYNRKQITTLEELDEYFSSEYSDFSFQDGKVTYVISKFAESFFVNNNSFKSREKYISEMEENARGLQEQYNEYRQAISEGYVLRFGTEEDLYDDPVQIIQEIFSEIEKTGDFKVLDITETD